MRFNKNNRTYKLVKNMPNELRMKLYGFEDEIDIVIYTQF